MERQVYEALQVRFVKIHFTIAFLEDSRLPEDKVSAIRGGMGEMLLRKNCVRDRQCEVCDFESECIVQRMMYTKFVKKPEFVTTGGSVGYVLECEDYREFFKAGGKLKFNLILFGRNIVYFEQYVQAFQILGEQEGIGKNHARFRIVEIRNTEGLPLLEGNSINMNRYVIHVLYDYVMFRKMQIDIAKPENIIVFDTPLTLKYQQEYRQEFQMEAILNAIKRRIYMLDCFEGIESDICHYNNCSIPTILYQQHRLIHVYRYSARKNEKMILRGIKGYAVLSELPLDSIELLLAGELIHIGKNTSFGFGKYHILPDRGQKDEGTAGTSLF